MLFVAFLSLIVSLWGRSEDLELPMMNHSCFKAIEVKRDEFGTSLKAWKSKGTNLPKVETYLF